MTDKSSSQSKLFEKFTKLSYDPVLDSDSLIKLWIQNHKDGRFTSFIGGSYVDVSDTDAKSLEFTTKNPANSADLAKLVRSDEVQIKNAIDSSARSFTEWKSLSGIERGRIIYNIARNIQKHLLVISTVEAFDSGRTLREVKDLDVATIIRTFYYYAGAFSFDDTYEPLGVVAIFGHYDSSLLSIASKLAAALAGGNTCVLVPNSLTPLSAFLLAEIMVQAGVPAGVVNVLVSDRNEILSQVASNPLVACVTYDGLPNVAQEYLFKQNALNTNQKCLLSLNGKSTLLLYDSADIDSAVECVVDGCLYSNGQHRYSLNKVLVQENIYDDVLHRLQRRFGKLRAGSNLDKCNDYGPFISESEYSRSSDMLGNLKYGNALVFEKQDKSVKNVYSPMIITNLETNTEYYQSDCNGPYVIVVPFRTVKESIELVNTQRTSSAVSVWSQNISLVMEVAYNLQVGTVWSNSFGIEKGVEVRKTSGNYNYTGEQSVLNFKKPKWTESFEYDEKSNTEVLDKTIKSFGGVDQNASIPNAELSNNLSTYKLYIGGKQARPDSQGSRGVYVQKSDGSRQLQCLVADATRKDVRNAVEAANAAYNDWKKRTNFNKAQIIYYFGENISKRREEFVKTLQVHTNKSKELCENEFNLCLNQIFYYASICDKNVGRLNDTTDNGTLMEIQETIGCVAIVCGETAHPLLTVIVHFLAAISYGNSVVIVPDEKSPLPALDLYEVFETSDMPGIVNILSGNKHHLTKHLCEHEQVRSVWYMCENDKADSNALQFVKYTCNTLLKSHWFIKSSLFKTPLDKNLENFLLKDYSKELQRHSVQYKYIHLPMGVIFAN